MWFPECPLFEGKNTLQKRYVTKCCSEFRDGRFSEVANVLQVWDFQSVTRTLSALGSVSASRSVRSGTYLKSRSSFPLIKNVLVQPNADVRTTFIYHVTLINLGDHPR